METSGLSTLIGIVIGLAVLWAGLLVLFWALRPKGVAVREILGVVPDVLRLLRSVIGDSAAPRSRSTSACSRRAMKSSLPAARN